MKNRLLSFAAVLALCLSLCPAAFAAGPVTVTKTNIKADGVMNAEGYGSVVSYVDEEAGHFQTGLIDRNGAVLFPYTETVYGQYRVSDGIVSLTQNLYEVLYYYSEETETETLVSPQYYHLDGTPLFDTSAYGSGTPMQNGYAIVCPYVDNVFDALKPQLVDQHGTVVYTFPEEFAGGGLGDFGDSWYSGIGFYSDLRLGWPREGLVGCYHFESEVIGDPDAIYYMDMSGNRAFSLSENYDYIDAWWFWNGFAAVQDGQTGLFGFINKSGNLAIPCAYTDVIGFDDGLAGAKKDGKWGYINAQNETVIPFMYDDAYGAGDGLAAVVKDGKCGLVDYNNNVVVPLEYDDISSYTDGAAYAVKDGCIYIITGYDSSAADVPSAWAAEEVSAAIEAGLVPEALRQNYTKAISRGDVAQMFINLLEAASGKTIDEIMADKGVSINSGAFTDTADKAVLAANALGIIQGVGHNKFDPDGTLTRAQIAAIINRAARVMGVETEGYTHSFTDVAGHWVSDELGWPVHAKIIEGVGNNRFDPDGKLTTEQAIAITYRALQALR